MSRIAVVGAGMAGLAAARALQAQGFAVTVFEKSRGFGGRCATRWIGDYRFDTGATFVTPDGHALGAVMQTELSTDGLIQIEKPMFACSKGRVMSGAAAVSRDSWSGWASTTASCSRASPSCCRWWRRW
ncbi:FAD-dependent oxidoreductase [Aphanothece stagnina]|uniref:FAD-dependent oxidoreductase n=1 Tax=Aphanothece stagnina TaxID=1004305 RepID=UPI00398F6EF5